MPNPDFLFVFRSCDVPNANPTMLSSCQTERTTDLSSRMLDLSVFLLIEGWVLYKRVVLPRARMSVFLMIYHEDPFCTKELSSRSFCIFINTCKDRVLNKDLFYTLYVQNICPLKCQMIRSICIFVDIIRVHIHKTCIQYLYMLDLSVIQLI